MKNRKGLTLIEVIISIALITLIAVTFLGVFNMGNKLISSSGHRTNNILEVKEKIDKRIKEYEDKTDGIAEIQVTIPGVATDILINGSIIEVKSNSDPNMKITTFVPNKTNK